MARYLLDTHIVLWWFGGDTDQLGESIRRKLRAEPMIFISPISLLEITMKQARGKLTLPAGFVETISQGEFPELPLRHRHAITAGRLPDIHRDPFDRFLIAQAQCENLTLVTRDAMIAKYDVTVLPA